MFWANGLWTVAKVSVDDDWPARLAASKTLFAASVFETAIAHTFALNMRCLPYRSLGSRIKICFYKFATAPWLTHGLLCAFIHARLMNTFSCPNRFRRLMDRPDCSDVPVKNLAKAKWFLCTNSSIYSGLSDQKDPGCRIFVA